MLFRRSGVYGVGTSRIRIYVIFYEEDGVGVVADFSVVRMLDGSG